MHLKDVPLVKGGGSAHGGNWKPNPNKAKFSKVNTSRITFALCGAFSTKAHDVAEKTVRT